MPTPRPPLDRFARDRTAQSETLAVLLLVAMTVVGSGAVVVFGAGAIDDTTASADIGKAEHAMTQLDSKTSLVAHGSSDTQRVGFGRAGRGATAVDESSGRMIVRVINGTNGNETILDEQLGTVTYERGSTTLAYQGGGVWRRDGNGSTMVSPPEFHYQQGTLTLPLVRVQSDGLSGRAVRITQRTPTDGQFPNATRSNPLTEGRVYVTVRSDYYRAWGTYFAERTGGTVAYDHTNESATVELVTPFKGEFDNIVASTTGGITANGGDPPTPSQAGTDYPSADGRIEDRIDDCLSGGCESWETDDEFDDAGTYYTESDVKNDDIEVETGDGDVHLVVNASFEPKTVDVTGPNNVTVYVRNDADFGEANEGGNAERFRVLVHSSGEVDMNGNAIFVGLLYAPESNVDLNGNGVLVGGLVGGSVEINGLPANDFGYDPAVRDIELNLGGAEPRVLYLHVSVTSVDIENG